MCWTFSSEFGPFLLTARQDMARGNPAIPKWKKSSVALNRLEIEKMTSDLMRTRRLGWFRNIGLGLFVFEKTPKES